jgi:hypothetical protein
LDKARLRAFPRASRHLVENLYAFDPSIDGVDGACYFGMAERLLTGRWFSRWFIFGACG